MCGIAGLVSVAAGPQKHAVLERMLGVLRHRGPDDSGNFSDGAAWLGHRRLSIIDLAHGHQPMANEDSTVWITYNGELFNHASLRPELERAGHRYQTNCDTEAILHAYEQHGVECVRQFRGMFAFAVWDQRRKRLFCARDRLGIKPFYYYWDGRLFAFASEIKALLEHPAISASMEASLLPEYLAFGYTSGERTLFAGIRKLMPGHTLTLELEDGAAKLDIERYWDVPEQGPCERRPDEDWIRECRERLEETVRMRLMSDVPLGVFLSGGVDSSAITALVKRMASGPVETFAVGYREAAFSELAYARQVAQSIGTDHREVTVSMQEFFEALPRLIWHEDEPIVWPSSVSLYFVSKLASERVKVVLTGEGSDELFGGYSRYRFYLLNRRWAAAWRLLPAGLRRRIRSWVGETRLLPAGLRRKLRHTPVGQGEALESLYLDNFYSAFPASEQAGLLGSDQGDEPYRSFLGYWNARTGASLVERMLYADQKTYLVELLMKQDQMSMATSIESRVPFLDHPFVEFAARVPQALKIRGRTAKYILKRAVEDLLPAEIVHRRKMGFPTPLREWLRRPEAAPLFERLGDQHGLLAEYLDRRAVAHLLERHRNGWEDATDRIWRLLNLQLWGDIFITGRGGRGAFESAAPTFRTP
ncbi:MAG: asparagine synthase (glutamine-hydrolyzing) [Bryobacteraceae bacterium]